MERGKVSIFGNIFINYGVLMIITDIFKTINLEEQ